LELNNENMKTKEEILDSKFKERGIRKGWIDESKQAVLDAMEEYADEKLRLYHVSSTLPQWTDNDVDAAYLIGCMNAGGLDSIPKEVERLKELGLKPNEAVKKIRGKR
jgi:hypothetical protein